MPSSDQGLKNPQQLKAQIDFLREVEKLKTVTRANRTLDGRNENSAEHSWHVTLMALVLQQHVKQPLDMLKVAKMLLIHDIVEIDAGDTWLYAEDQQTKQKLEANAADRLFSLLPDKQCREYMDLWQEFESRSSAEAGFAAAIDGIQPLLNHLITGQAEDGVIPLEKVRKRKAYIRRHAPLLWELVESLIKDSEARGLYG